MGLRVLELQTFRERLQKRRVRLLPMLQWVSSNVWKASSRGCETSHDFLGVALEVIPGSASAGFCAVSSWGEVVRALPTQTSR